MINRQNIRRQASNIINFMFALDFFNDPIHQRNKKNDHPHSRDFT